MNNNVTIANFNVTFGKADRPLLEYFKEIAYPAFLGGFVRYVKQANGQSDKYYFIDIKIVEAKKDDFFLTGKIIKDTILEIKSKIENQKLVPADEHYPSAPYSTFYISLKNHRMILIRNQKGSPNIKSFGATASFIMKEFIKETNERIKELNKDKSDEDKIELLPYARVKVVGIPMKSDLKEALKGVSKMRKLKLKMYPLNGDLDLNEMVQAISSDLRSKVGSKTGNITLNSPESKKGVIELIDASQGVFETTLDVEYPDKSKDTITNDKYSGRTTWILSEEEINDIDSLKDKIYGLDSINIVSSENQRIYENAKDFLRKL